MLRDRVNFKLEKQDSMKTNCKPSVSQATHRNEYTMRRRVGLKILSCIVALLCREAFIWSQSPIWL